MAYQFQLIVILMIVYDYSDGFAIKLDHEPRFYGSVAFKISLTHKISRPARTVQTQTVQAMQTLFFLLHS